VPEPRSLSFVRAAALSAVVALVVGACASTPAGWTYAPQPSVTPFPSPTGSAAPTGSPGATGTAAPTGGTPPPASPGGSGNGTTVKIAAQNIAFDVASIDVPAGVPWSIDFNNEDAGIPHNVAIKDGSGNQVFMGEIITGPKETTYSAPALTAGGTYTFVCDVHPNMTGTITLK